MDLDGTESLLEFVDQLRRKAEESKNSDNSIFKKRTAKRSNDLAGLAALAFSEGAIQRALDWLTSAINILPSAALYTKRSVVHLTLQHNILAAADAMCAIGMDPNYASGYLCAAMSWIRLGEYEEGLHFLENLRRCFPNSRKINSIYVSCRNSYWLSGKIPPLEPPKSIAKDLVHEEYSAFQENKLNDLKVELSHSGVLEAAKLTEDFVRRVIETYKRGVFHLPQKYVFMILKNVLDILREHSNIVSIDISSKQTLTVVGDLRGKFNNLLSIFRHNRTPHFGRPFLFNGNVIGNDKMSLPVLIIVLCLKILFPEDVFINRGSEECLEMCDTNGFETEVLTVYDEDTMKGFTEVFNWLPVAHILNNNVLIIHGGLFEDEKVTLADLQSMKRCYQPPDSGPMSDILYSDPWNYKGMSKKDRRRGIWFGPDVTERFCQHNCIDYIVRSHQDVGEFGYELQTYRQCLTVDSSTNYATYLLIRGKTSSFKSVHARKDKLLPKHCKCFLVCNCKSPEVEKHTDPLHNGYVTTNLELPSVPSILEERDGNQPDASNPSLMSKSIPSVQHSLASSRANSKPILVTSRKITPKSSDLRVNFSTSNKLMDSKEPELEDTTDFSGTENRSPSGKDLFLSQSIVVVSANYPAPMSSSSISRPSGVSANKLANTLGSNSQGTSHTTSSTNSISAEHNLLERTSSKANLQEVPKTIADETLQDTIRSFDEVNSTLFVSSKENKDLKSSVAMDHSPDNTQAVAGEIQNTAVTADSKEITHNLGDMAAELPPSWKDPQNISNEESDINQNYTEHEDEPAQIELLDTSNAPTNELYSKLAVSSSQKYKLK